MLKFVVDPNDFQITAPETCILLNNLMAAPVTFGYRNSLGAQIYESLLGRVGSATFSASEWNLELHTAKAAASPEP